MKLKRFLSTALPACVALVQILSPGAGVAQDTDYAYFKKWRTVANNNNTIPGSTKNFNSYNQPSINSKGLLVFRARAKGPNPESGIFTRDMSGTGGVTVKIADRTTVVPAPNNTLYKPDDTLAMFNEYPSIPRIAQNASTVATRGNSQPVWTYILPDMTETKVGTSGIFANPAGSLITGVNLLGAVPNPGMGVVGTDYFPYFQVPGAVAGTRFDVFPGSPAVTDENIIAFKGNYTENLIGKTGVFYRDLTASGGLAPVSLIANTSTVIPNLPSSVTGITFGSTAPPSAANGKMVFAGYDNEASPTYGGIYLAPLSPSPVLTTLIGIGSPVPNVAGETFKQFGEALSFDGRYVAFWGAWGTETKHLVLDCPTDGNKDLLAYCLATYPNGYGVDIPVHQGIFVHDTTTGVTTMVAQTGSGIDDFIYWTFSGKPPGVGGGDEGDGELPRWRSSAFVAVSGSHISGAETAFKARTGVIVSDHYDNPVDSIFWSHGADLTKLLDTTTDGRSIDPDAPAGSTVSALSIERESFRGHWLAISVSMLEPVSGESMAGIYVTGAGLGNPCFDQAVYSYITAPDPQHAWYLYYYYYACGMFDLHSAASDYASAYYSKHYYLALAHYSWYHYAGNEGLAQYYYYYNLSLASFYYYSYQNNHALASYYYYYNLALAGYCYHYQLGDGNAAIRAYYYYIALATYRYYYYTGNGALAIYYYNYYSRFLN